MATKRIAPKGEARNFEIEFTDGKRILPSWQWPFLQPDIRKIAMTYDRWVETVVNVEMVSSQFRTAVEGQINAHFAGFGA